MLGGNVIDMFRLDRQVQIKCSYCNPSADRGCMLPFLQLPRIFFEFGAVSVLPDELAGLGFSRPLFVTDGNLIGLDVYARVRRTVPAGVDVAEFCDVPENPTAAAAHQVLALYRARDCNGIVAIGGGSVIDCAKAAAFLVSHPGNLGDYLGRPDRITSPPAPLIAIPTTAGTGSEVSRGCGIHPGARAAASQQIAIEEANELARLAVEQAADKRQLRRHVLAGLSGRHRGMRRSLRRRQRHQRAGLAVPLLQLRPRVTRQRQYSRVMISGGLRALRLPPGRA